MRRLLGLLVGVILSALFVVAGYQARPSYDVQVGGPLDAPLLRGFNTREVTTGDDPIPFRWTTARSEIVLSQVGQQELQVTLTANGARPAGVPTATLRVSAGDTSLLEVVPVPAFLDYTFSVPRALLPGGTLTLTLEADTFIPAGDPNPRPLGVVLTRVRALPGPSPDFFIPPSWDVLLSVVATSTIVGLVLLLLGFGPGVVGFGVVIPGLLAGWLLVADRLWLTGGEWYKSWPGMALAAAIVAGLGVLGLAWVRRVVPQRVGGVHGRLLLALIFAMCLVRLAGQLHPQIFIVDLNFHRNRFDTVLAGDLLFTIQSDEWGGRETFYLPTAYLGMLPLQWLLSDKLLVLRLFTAAIGTLGAIPLFGIAARVWNARAGLFAAALYLMVPIAVLPYSWGITTNVFGEFFLLCALAVAVLAYPRLEPRRPAFWLLLFAFLIALLSHPGVVQLTVVGIGLLGTLWLVAGREDKERRRAGAWVGVALVSAGIVSYLVYYRHFLDHMLSTLGDLARERGTEARPGIGVKVGGSVNDPSLGLIVRYAESWGDWLWGGLRGFWQEAQAYYRVWPVVGAVLGVLGMYKFKAQSSGFQRGATPVVLAGVAWGLTALVFTLVGWTLNLYVRYALFLLPVVALGAGVLLARLWAKGKWGVALGMLVLVFFAVEALGLWHYRISYAFK